MKAKDTILAGCEIICIGEQPTDLIACPLSDEEQEKCRSRRQYQAGIEFAETAIKNQLLEIIEASKKAGRKEVVEWGETICMEHGMRKRRKCDKCWQAKVKEWEAK